MANLEQPPGLVALHLWCRGNAQPDDVDSILRSEDGATGTKVIWMGRLCEGYGPDSWVEEGCWWEPEPYWTGTRQEWETLRALSETPQALVDNARKLMAAKAPAPKVDPRDAEVNRLKGLLAHTERIAQERWERISELEAAIASARANLYQVL